MAKGSCIARTIAVSSISLHLVDRGPHRLKRLGRAHPDCEAVGKRGQDGLVRCIRSVDLAGDGVGFRDRLERHAHPRQPLAWFSSVRFITASTSISGKVTYIGILNTGALRS
jgi:hypothetical protein